VAVRPCAMGDKVVKLLLTMVYVVMPTLVMKLIQDSRVPTREQVARDVLGGGHKDE